MMISEGMEYPPGAVAAEPINFKGCVVHLDGAILHDCIFDDCRLVYSGGPLPNMSGCTMNSCNFVLDDGALRTVQFLAGFNQIRNGGSQVLENFLAAIRAGVIPDVDATRPPGATLN